MWGGYSRGLLKDEVSLEDFTSTEYSFDGQIDVCLIGVKMPWVTLGNELSNDLLELLKALV